MNIFKKLFGGNTENSEERQREQQARDFDILKYDGVRALKSGQAAYAIECLHCALDIKDDLECHDYLSQALIHHGDLGEAYEQLQTLAEAEPDNQQIYIRMAAVAYMLEDYTAMANACEKAMLINKENPQVLYSYARACIGQDDTVNAVAMLTKAITLKPDYGDAYLLRGETLLKTGDLDAAEEDADYLLAHTENNEDVLLLKARIQEARGLHAEAIDGYGRVLAANPFCIAAFSERGHIRQAQGDEAGAQSDFAEAKKLTLPEQDAASDGTVHSEPTQNIQQQVEQAYKNINPFGGS